MGKETGGSGDEAHSLEAGRENILLPDNFTFQKATVAQTAVLTEYYNRVIVRNAELAPTRTLHWLSYTEDTMREVIQRGEVFFITPKTDEVANMPPITAAIMLDTNRDYGAWPEHEGILPANALHASKFAIAPGLENQRIAEKLMIPLTINYAREQGFEAIYFEAYPIEGLDNYYRSVGVTPHGEKTYRSAYYNRIITANRYSLDLRSSPKK